MDASEDYMDNMFGAYTPAKYFVKKKKKVSSDDSVKAECGKAGGEECGAYKGSSSKVQTQVSKTAERSKKSNFQKPKLNLKGRVVHKGDA
jgi:hypothetical protein